MKEQPQRGTAPKTDLRTLPVGLVCEGGITKSYFGKLDGIVGRIGPVKASSLRVASRVSNALRIGTPTVNYEDLDGCGMVVVIAQPGGFASVLDELLAAQIDWNEKVLLLLDSAMDCEELSMFARRNAIVATMELIEAYTDLRFVIQADPRTIRRLRSLINDSRVRLFEIAAGTKALYFASMTITTSMANPLMGAGVECLLGCGMELSLAQGIVDQTLHRTQRAFMKAGKRGWSGALEEKDSAAIHRQWKRLQKKNILLADYFAELATISLEYYRQDSKIIHDLASIPRRYAQRKVKTEDSSKEK